MGKIEKKKARLKENIERMESELLMALTKKTSDTREINVGEYQRRIQDMKKELQKM